MLDIFVHFFDTIFPPQADIKILKGEDGERFLRHFTPHRYLDTIALSSYDTPAIKAAITANKFHDYEPAATLLASLLTHWHSTQPETDTIYVSIPLSKERERSRGYNQVTRVIEASRVPATSIINRIKHTKPQTSLNRTERFANMHDVFAVSIPKKFPYKRVVIVDDVVTTGATLRAAREVLESHLPTDCQIICIALAH